MLKGILLYLSTLCLSFFLASSFALEPVTSKAAGKEKETTYKLVYDSRNKDDKIPLKNVIIRLKLFADGTPLGYRLVHTGPNQKFKMPSDVGDHVIFEVLQIHTDSKVYICSGTSAPGENEVTVICRK
jgi:hypothetical protein